MFSRELWHRHFLEFKFLNEFFCGLFLILIAEIIGKETIKLIKRLNLPPSGRSNSRGDCGSVWPKCREESESESEIVPPQLKTFYYAVIATCVRIDETLGTLPIGTTQREEDSYSGGFADGSESFLDPSTSTDWGSGKILNAALSIFGVFYRRQ